MIKMINREVVNIRNSKLVLPDETFGLIFVLLSLEGLSCLTVHDNYFQLKEYSRCLHSSLFLLFCRLLFMKFINICKEVLQTPCYCVGLPTLTFHRRYQHRHLAGLSAVCLVESELCAKVTMIMSTFSSCPTAKTSSTTLLLEDQEW